MFDIGSSLREARTRQGLDFKEMEDRTKVRPKYLRFLEEERFEELPGHTYTKGFLRAYADALGLDGGLYVDEYNSRYVVEEESAVHTRGSLASRQRQRQRDPRRDRRSTGRRESRSLVVALAAILVLTALVIAAWRFGGDEAPSVQGVNAGATAPTEADAAAIRLVVRAVGGPTFVEVRAGGEDGAPLYAGTLEQGQVQAFTRRSFSISVATPRNVVVLVNGEETHVPASGQLAIAAAAPVG